MVGKIPRKIRDKNSFRNYLKKAEQFVNTMNDCMSKKQYDSAALNGIHAIISSIDALLVFRAGVVSSSQNHVDAVKLLLEIVIDPEAKSYTKHALAVIKLKTTVEYFDSLTTEKQADEIVKHTTRFFEWAKLKLP